VRLSPTTGLRMRVLVDRPRQAVRHL